MHQPHCMSNVWQMGVVCLLLVLQREQKITRRHYFKHRILPDPFRPLNEIFDKTSEHISSPESRIQNPFFRYFPFPAHLHYKYSQMSKTSRPRLYLPAMYTANAESNILAVADWIQNVSTLNVAWLSMPSCVTSANKFWVDFSFPRAIHMVCKKHVHIL